MLKKMILVFAIVLSLGLIWAQGSEDFSTVTLPTSYSDGSFVGNNGITWTYGHSRNPDGYFIDGEGLLLRRASDSYLMATIPGGIGNFSFEYRKAYTGANARNLELIINDVQVGTTGVFGNTTGADETIHTFSHDVNTPGAVQVKIKLVGNASTNTQSVIDNLVWTGYQGQASPTIFVTGALSAFSTLEGIPSLSQSYSVSGSTLSNPIQITAPAGFEISLDEEDSYQSTLNLSLSNGDVADTPIYVRLTGAAEGSYSGDITHVSSGAESKIMAVSGTVFSAISDGYYVDFEGEGEVKTGYASATVNLGGLDWDMTNSLIGIDAGDFKNGLRSARFNGKTGSSMTMLEDKANGLGTISFLYRKWGTDAVVDWFVEYSADGGNEWTQIGDSFVGTTEILSFSEVVNVGGSVRIRIRTDAINATTNKRINIDDILLTDYTTGGTPIIHLSGDIDPLANIVGNPSEELGEYQLWGENLSASIHITAPEHFEVATSAAGPWHSATTVSSSFNGTIYVRLNSNVIGEHSGNIMHTSGSAEPKSIRVEGETYAPDGSLHIINNMIPFSQEPGIPSPAQSYYLSGSGISSEIEISTAAPFELSLNGVDAWTHELSLAYNFSGYIFVRLNGDTPGASYADHPILHTNTSIQPTSIFVSGSILPTEMQGLFFSEYIEGSSNNKALEIFNPTSVVVDLSEYKVQFFANGASAPNNTQVLSGTLTPGGVYVIANTSAAPAILNIADITSPVANFNGDDALALVHISTDTILDVFGTIGTDPGTAWDVAGTTGATLDHTLIRKANVMQGTTNWAQQAGTNADDSEWIVMPNNYFENLGSHSYSGGGDLVATPSFDPPAGAYINPINVSISSSTAGASIRYTTDGSLPSPTTGILYTAPVSISATTTLKAIAYAAGAEPSYIASALYSFPTLVSNIAELRSMPTGTNNIYKLTGEAVITYQNANRNTKYIQDATAAIVIDDLNGIITTQYNLYDGITGIVGTLGLYSQLLQFVPVANAPAATSSGNVIVPEIRTLASLTPADQAKLIKVQNLGFQNLTENQQFPATAQNLTVSDGTATLTLRTFVNTDYAATLIPTEAIDLICLVGQFNNDMQVGHRFLSDILPVSGNLEVPNVIINQSASTITLSWTAIPGATSYRIEASDNPYEGFSVLDNTNGTTFSTSSNDHIRRFFRVIAE